MVLIGPESYVANTSILLTNPTKSNAVNPSFFGVYCRLIFVSLIINIIV